MLTADLVKYYADLLILQYRGKTRAHAMIESVVTPVIMDQLPTSVQDAFDLSDAAGVQLDVIGKYVGVTRYGYDFSGPVTLDDADFRSLIRLAIIGNSAGSSLSDIQSLLQVLFAGTIFVFDHQDMRMSYFLDADGINLSLAQFFIKGSFLPKPMAVQLAVIIYASDLQFFAMQSAKTIKAYADQNSLTIAQAANALLVAENIWQFNSVASPIVGQWLSAQQGVI